MLTETQRCRRSGIALIEVVIAIVVAGIVLSLISSISVRQQRLLSEIADAVAVAAQLREISTILPTDLRSVAVAARDVREATDTSIELRSTIATAVVCDSTSNGVLLAPSSSGAATYAGFATSVEPGDTAWIFTAGDSADAWQPSAIASVSTVNAGARGAQCAASGPQLGDSARALPRLSIGLAPPTISMNALIGLPIRVTRSVRYSLYRASDGGWYVGEREWNPATLRFSGIQPVSGPFLPATAGGMSLTYLDSAGATLPAPLADTRAIAAIRSSFRAQSKRMSTELGSAASSGRRIDSATVVTLLHNRR